MDQERSSSSRMTHLPISSWEFPGKVEIKARLAHSTMAPVTNYSKSRSKSCIKYPRYK